VNKPTLGLYPGKRQALSYNNNRKVCYANDFVFSDAAGIRGRMWWRCWCTNTSIR